MRIAFDLDGTLIEAGFAFPTIKKQPKFLLDLCGIESLREGTVELMHFFQAQGDEIWVYTTSFRHTLYIRVLFGLHGIYVKGVINQAVHNQRIKQRTEWPRCSKYPPAFGIDLLIDDQEGVKMEAERYGFRMIWVKPQEAKWVEQIKVEYQQMKEEVRLLQSSG